MSAVFPTGSQRRRATTVWLLVGLILLQPVLTYLATPWFAQDDAGHYVTLCTLEGERQVYVGDLFDEPAGESGHCPALKLLQLAGTAATPVPPTAAAGTLYLVALVDQTSARAHRSLHFSAYASRAPPIA